LINAGRNTGGSIGVSIVSNVLTHREQFHQSRLVESVLPSSIQYQDTLHRLTDYFVDQGNLLVQAQQQATQWIGQQVQAQATFLSRVRSQSQWASDGAGATLRNSGTSSVAITNVTMIARKASA
jgi:hypothetical protein